MKILVFCPTNELFGRTLQSIFCLDWSDPIHFLFTKDNPYDDPAKNIQHNYILGREWLLEREYDAMLTVESDMVIPPDALTKMVKVPADVVYGLYCWRHGAHEWNAYLECGNGDWPAFSVSQKRDLAKTWWGTVQTVTGLGFGCTLIRRHVLEAVEFSLEDEKVPDSMLARECNRLGFEQKCDLSVVCGHVRRHPPMIVWPDAREDLYRVEII